MAPKQERAVQAVLVDRRNLCGWPRMPAALRGCSIPRMSVKKTETHPRVGDWLEAHGIHGEPARRGEIVEVLGEPGHEHYKVRWDEQHESIVYPADGVNIVHKDRR
jgi:hypothetical protein